MNTLRFGFGVTTILGVIYAFAGMFDSLTDFGVGLVVASLGCIGYYCIDYIEAGHDRRIAGCRDDVWARRDAEMMPDEW